MLQQLKRITSGTAIYGLGGVTTRVIGFFLLPVYCHVLPVAEYGKLTYFNILSVAISMFMVLGLVAAMYRYLPQLEKEGREQDIISTIFFFMLIIGGALAATLTVFAPKISLLIFSDILYTPYIRLIIVSAFALSLNSLFFGVLRYKERAIQFISIVIGKTIVGLSLNIIAVVVLRMGVKGILIANVIVEVVALIVIIWICRRSLRLGVDFELLPRLLRYGVPLIMASVGSYMLSYTGIYFLEVHTSMETVGHYGLAMKFSSIVMIFVITPFDQAWNPIKFRMLDEPDHKQLFARLLDYVLLIAGFMGLTISVLVPDVIRLLAPASYLPAVGIVPFLCLSVILYGAYRVVTIGSEVAEKTSIRAMLVFIWGIVNLGANTLLAPHYGLNGVIVALLIAYSGLFLTMFVYSQMCYRLPYRIRRIVHMIVVFATFYLVQYWISLPIWLAISLKTLLLSFLPIVLWFTCFFDDSEKGVILRKLRDFRAKLLSKSKLAQ
jgi:O-antigen/teichoic acid export membrane protein